MSLRRGAFVLLVLLVSACRKHADAGAEGRAAAKAAATRALSHAHVPGIGYAAVRVDREIVSGGVGVADRTSGAVVTASTVFEAASIAKTLIATCVMQLVEDGRLDLDEDAGKYIGFALRHPIHREPITLRMLLMHRGSIRDHHAELVAPRKDVPLALFLERYFVAPRAPGVAAFFDDPPGTRTAYSNVGAALAALAVERVAAQSFSDVSSRRVFDVLRMTSTAWEARSLVATPHALRDGTIVALPQASHALYPVVDLRSSARDLGRFARAILRGGELDGARILSPASVRVMLAAGADGDPEQALAWQLRTMAGRRVAGHEGEDAGASAALFLDLEAGAGAVVLANGDAFGSGDPARAGAVQRLLVELLAAGAR